MNLQQTSFQPQYQHSTIATDKVNISYILKFLPQTIITNIYILIKNTRLTTNINLKPFALKVF